jgi:hypothetical protein
MHKGFKCLDISKGHIYISPVVIFDESVFPFASLHPTVSARYTYDVLLLPGDNEITYLANVSTISTLPIFDLPVQVSSASSCTLHGTSNHPPDLIPIASPCVPPGGQHLPTNDFAIDTA